MARALPWRRLPSLAVPATAVSGPAGRLVLPLLTLVAAAVLLVSVGRGAVPIAPGQVLAILAERAGLALPVAYGEREAAVLWAIRLPRVVMSALAGAALATSGAILQGVFRNPLADPALIGVTSGAAAAVALVVLTGVSGLGLATLPAAAFAGGLLTTLLLYRFARRGGRTEVLTLVLAGIAVNALLGATISLAVFVADDPQMRDIVFWMMGSLGGSVWNSVAVALPPILLALILLMRSASELNLLLLGEAEARHLGVDVERLRLRLISLAALATGATVAFTGTIGFVGLVVPHLLRLLTGPDHRVLLPASALGGAALVAAADLLARTAIAPAELPLGIVMAAVGAPLFLYLIERTRREHGGWR